MLEFHPVADIFPMMHKDAFEELVADIEANGLENDIVVYKGKIVDGRNRAKACERLNIKARSTEYEGTEEKLLDYVISMNLKRRHLDESQRAMASGRIENLRHGRPKKDASSQLNKVDRMQASKMLSISPRSTAHAKVVLTKGTKDLIAAVDAGEIAVSVAAKLAELPKAVQDKAVKDPERAALLVKQQTRQEHEEALATQIKGLPTKKYGVILADPEWKFAVWSEETGQDRAAANHYATSTIEQIKQRDVPSISADDCVLFLWATVPMLDQAIEVLKAWEFEYKSNFAWLKDKAGTGYWNRNIHEHLLIGTKGDIPCPAPGKQFESAFDAPVGKHSAKPDFIYELIETYFPTLPKIELNARKKRKGWSHWGAEAPVDMEAAE